MTEKEEFGGGKSANAATRRLLQLFPLHLALSSINPFGNKSSIPQPIGQIARKIHSLLSHNPPQASENRLSAREKGDSFFGHFAIRTADDRYENVAATFKPSNRLVPRKIINMASGKFISAFTDFFGHPSRSFFFLFGHLIL